MSALNFFQWSLSFQFLILTFQTDSINDLHRPLFYFSQVFTTESALWNKFNKQPLKIGLPVQSFPLSVNIELYLKEQLVNTKYAYCV